jgi:putative aldouronate transport system permease protein
MQEQKRGKRGRRLLRDMIRQRELILMSIPIMIYVFIFSYLPLGGWAMAFQRYRPGRDVQEWIGFEHFEFLFTDPVFFRVMRNTLGMSAINLVLGFSCAIFLALMINEIRQKAFKRLVQTISYMPHFFSWVIAVSMIAAFLASDGILNRILTGLGLQDSPNIFLGNPDYSWWIVGWSNVWKSVGWNTIIYLAAITAIDPQLYESAEIDGAGRFSRIWHVTLPGIKSTILVLVIMNIGWILNAGFEVQYLLANGLTMPAIETIDVFVIRYGINLRNYSLATALGMFKTVVSIVLILGANYLSKKFAKESLV